MGYDFHTTRRWKTLSFHLSDKELALFNSAMARRGFEHNTHYIRALVLEDGELMAEPEVMEAAFAEQSPQKSMSLAPFPRSWKAMRARLAEMVRAAMIVNPDDVPQWALQFDLVLPNIKNTSVEVCTNEVEGVPASESKPKAGAHRPALKAASRRSSGMK